MRFRTGIAAVTAALLLCSPLAADDKNSKAECDKTKQKIRNIQSKMRSGYTRAQGEKLEVELRKLRAKRKKNCR
jgi:hypothetical protein